MILMILIFGIIKGRKVTLQHKFCDRPGQFEGDDHRQKGEEGHSLGPPP